MKIKSQEQENSLRVHAVEGPRRNEPISPVKPVLPVGTKDLEKLQAAKAGELLLNQAVRASKKSRQMQEEAQERAREREENSKLRDRTQLEGQQPERTREVENAWAEEIQKLLKLILQWQPLPGQSLNANLAALQKLYQEIYEYILKNFSGEFQQVCLLRLKEEMLQAITKTMQINLSELSEFISNPGEDGGLPGVASSIYHQLTGRRLSTSDGRALVRQYRTGSSYSAKILEGATASMKSGYIYKREAASRIAVDDFYCQENTKSAASQMPKGAILERSLEGLSREESLGQAAVAKTMRLKELESAENFASYMNREGARLPEASVSTRNEEMMGVMMGTVYIKTAVFLQQSQIGKDLSSYIQNAVERFVRNRLLGASSQLKSQNAQQESPVGGLDYRDISRVSSSMQKTYHKTGNFRTAILQGIKMAYERFQQKQENLEFSSLQRYQKGVGFFGGTSIGNPNQDMSRGLVFLREEWNRFIHAMQWGKKSDMRLESDFVREGLAVAGMLGKGKGTSEGPDEEQTSFILRTSFFVMCAGAVLLAVAGTAGITSLPVLGGGFLMTIVGGAIHARERKK